jgi:hypothetical protein
MGLHFAAPKLSDQVVVMEDTFMGFQGSTWLDLEETWSFPSLHQQSQVTGLSPG